MVQCKSGRRRNPRNSGIANVAVLFAIGFFAAVTDLQATCLSLIKGAIAFDVQSCRQVDPQRDFDETLKKDFYRGMTATDRKAFLKQYRGNIVKGKVAVSKAIRSGLSDEKGVLNGEIISLYLQPGASKCEEIKFKRIAGILDEKCCSGGADAPCLLDTTYVLKKVSVIGKMGSSAGDARRRKLAKSEDYKTATQLFAKKEFKAAIRLYKKLQKADELDAAGLYRMALSYRKLDQCSRTISMCKQLSKLEQRGEVSGDQLKFVRKGNFLLARCLAKTNKPGEAVIILNSYLIEPKRFRAEIKASLRHPDFGWINATKEYINYKKDAKAVLAKAR